MMVVLKRYAYEVVLGDVFSFDSHINDLPFHTDFLKSQLKDNSIAVLHCPDRASRMQTLGIIREAVPALLDRGLQFGTLSSLFNRSRHSIDHQQLQGQSELQVSKL